MKIGSIGLGVLGRPLALNFLETAHDLAICVTPAELARRCEVVFTMIMITSSADVQAVAHQPNAQMAQGWGRDGTASLLRVLESA